MKNEFNVLPRWVVNLFLWVGLFAGMAVRSLTLIQDEMVVVWVWRYAMISYTIFFGYRYVIGRRRRRIVTQHELIEVIQKNESLDPVSRQALLYILRSIVRSKELFNYIFICVLSIVALVLDYLLN